MRYLNYATFYICKTMVLAQGQPSRPRPRLDIQRPRPQKRGLEWPLRPRDNLEDNISEKRSPIPMLTGTTLSHYVDPDQLTASKPIAKPPLLVFKVLI